MADRIEIEGDDRLAVSKGTGRPPWGRRMLTLLIAVAAIGGFAMVVVYSYDRGGDAGGEKKAPVIAAQEGPTKMRPESPGGMSVPNQDKQVYGQIDSAGMPEKVERLLPPPEPIMTQPPPGTAKAMPPPAPPLSGPERDRIAREMNGIAPSAGKPDAGKSPPQVAARPPESRPAEKHAAQSPPVEPTTPEKTEAKEPPRTVASLESSFRIQIASLKSEEAAKSAWSRLSKQNADLFGKLQHQIVRIDLAGKGTFYRLQAGPLADASQAQALCSKVKQRKIGCLVVRP